MGNLSKKYDNLKRYIDFLLFLESEDFKSWME